MPPAFRRWHIGCAAAGLACAAAALLMLAATPAATTGIEVLLVSAIALGVIATFGAARPALSRARSAAAVAAPAPEYPAESPAPPVISSEQYAAAQRASAAALLAKDEFLATMSHEIRTPLNGVLPLLELVLSSPLAPDQREHITTAYGSAQAMLRIVDDILDYSKLDVGKVALENIGINLRDLVDNVSRLMRRSAEAKGLRLTARIDAGVRLAVRGDPVRLRQVLMNLVSNAIKFTARGEVGIHVARRGETHDAHDLLFSVRDTGIGMTSDAIANLFKPFSQGDASVTRAFGGTGLGLVICKRLVDLMGGDIGVRSEPGKGSQFWFRVPLAKVAGDLATRRDTLSRRVLACAGDPARRRRSQSSLADLGITQVDVVPSPAAALAALHDAARRGMHWRYGLFVVDAETTRGGTAAFVSDVLADATLGDLRIVVLDDGGQAGYTVADHDPRVAILQRSSSVAQQRTAIDALMAAPPDASVAEGVGDAGAARVSTPYPALRGDVLVVEDNAVNRKVAETLLAQYRLDVDTAENGALALGRLRARRFDLVLMDCQMPEMDGYTATRQWRRHEEEHGERAIPIVAMTAHSMLGDRDKCLDAGMDDYLTKPLSRETLERVLKRWLTPAGGARENAARSGDSTAETTKPDGNLPSPTPAHATAEANAFDAPVSEVAVLYQSDPDQRSLDRRGLDEDILDERVLDERVLDDLIELIGARVPGLARLFVDEARTHVAEIESAAVRGDVAAIVAAAHMLKSSSANFGATGFSALSKRIEETLRGSASADIAGDVRRLRPAFDLFAERLMARISASR